MASEAETSRVCHSDLCPICLEKYDSPRSIPTCGHSFCEHCLFTFVFNLQAKGELGSAFECPVCRKPQPVLDRGHVTMDWIKTFPLDSERIKEKAISAENVAQHQFCGPCEEEGSRNPGKKYCLDCQAFLCDSCVSVHRKFKHLRSHKLMDRTDECDFMAYGLEYNNYKKCWKHPDREVELFCKDEEVLLCLICSATSHKLCRNVVEISDCVNIKTESAVNELKSRLENIDERLEMLQKISDQNCDYVKSKLEQHHNDMKTARQNIISSLDDIVETAGARIKQLKLEADDDKFGITQTIKAMKNSSEKKQTFLVSVLKHGSPDEIFICTEKLADEVENLDSKVFEEDGKLNVTDVDSSIVDDLEKINVSLNLDSLSIISLSHKPSTHSRYTMYLESQIAYEIQKLEHHKIMFTEKCLPTFTSISVRNDGVMVLCDNCSGGGGECGCLCLYNTHTKSALKLKMFKPYSAAFMDRQTVILTTPSTKTISVISVDFEMKKENSIITKTTPKCLIPLNKKGNLAISWEDPPAFSLSEIDGSEIKNIDYFTQDSTGRTFKSFEFMAVDERRKHVIQPCREDKAVFCFDFSGNPVFKYNDFNLKSPRGVAVDDTSGIIYVCDSMSHSIHQLSATGQHISVIKHADLKSDLAVCFDRRRRSLWVSSSSSYDRVFCLQVST